MFIYSVPIVLDSLYIYSTLHNAVFFQYFPTAGLSQVLTSVAFHVQWLLAHHTLAIISDAVISHGQHYKSPAVTSWQSIDWCNVRNVTKTHISHSCICELIFWSSVPLWLRCSLVQCKCLWLQPTVIISRNWNSRRVFPQRVPSESFPRIGNSAVVVSKERSGLWAVDICDYGRGNIVAMLAAFVNSDNFNYGCAMSRHIKCLQSIGSVAHCNYLKCLTAFH